MASLQADGYGVAEDNAVLVSGALAGEDVTVQPVTRKRRRLITRTVEVHEASEDRIEPSCPASSICGGCSLQHMAPDAQIAMKQARVQSLLAHLQPGHWLAPLTADVWGYRRKARLGVRYVAKRDEVLVGFREQHGGFIVDTDRCWTLADPVGGLLKPIAALVAGLSEPTRVPQVEVSVGEDTTALVFRHLFELKQSDISKLIEFAGHHRLDIYLQSKGPESCTRLWPEDRSDLLHYELPETGVRIAFHPLDFVQVNGPVNRRLITEVIRLLEVSRGDRVLDAFCGIGNFTIPLATACDDVHGLESVAASIDRARYNAQLNNVDHARFDVADLYQEGSIPPLAAYNKVLLDPPRTGAEMLCSALADSTVETIVYVSCNPDTLARDAELLCAGGFRLCDAGVVDMFPHTAHVESIVRFKRA